MSELKKIVVPLSLNRDHTSQLQAAHWLARTFNCGLKLVHANEPYTDIYSAFVGMGTAFAHEVESEILKNNRETATTKLEDFCKNSGNEMGVEYVIHEGSAVEWILAEAAHTHMVVMGHEQSPSSPLIRFSTVAKVAARSDASTFIVPEKYDAKALENATILLCDDLEHNSWRAVSEASQLISRLETSALRHLHVTGISKENLQIALQTAAATTHSTEINTLNVDIIYSETIKGMKEKLRQRFQKQLPDKGMPAGCTYDVRVEEGKPLDVMGVQRRQFEPDIEIFGRHRAIHRTPFGFGRMPLGTMITGNSCVLIVPD